MEYKGNIENRILINLEAKDCRKESGITMGNGSVKAVKFKRILSDDIIPIQNFDILAMLPLRLGTR